ncbi:MAG: dihydroneopterin aldolase [Muribaculaceae bacterium]|nr:dihydroneopterin aldolase [Muribaculaceae bacterium]
MNKDSIELTGLRYHAFHGVLPSERVIGNEFEVDIRLEFNASQAMETDDLAATVDYGAAVGIVTDEMAVPSALIEHVAGRIRKALREAFPMVTGGSVRVSKLAPPIPRQMKQASFTTVWSD